MRRALHQSKQGFDRLAGPAGLVAFHAVGFDVPRALEGLAEQRGELGDLHLGARRHLAHALAEAADGAAEVGRSLGRHAGVAFDHRVLNFRRAPDGVDDATKLDESAVAERPA